MSSLAGQESTWRDQLIDMGKRDVLVLFDIRRYLDFLFFLQPRRMGAVCRSSCLPINGCRLPPVLRVMSLPDARQCRRLGILSAALLAAIETIIMETTRAWGCGKHAHPRRRADPQFVIRTGDFARIGGFANDGARHGDMRKSVFTAAIDPPGNGGYLMQDKARRLKLPCLARHALSAIANFLILPEPVDVRQRHCRDRRGLSGSGQLPCRDRDFGHP